MRCSNCNFNNDDNARFCKKCGSRLTSGIGSINTNSVQNTNSNDYKNIIIAALIIILLATIIIVVFLQQKQEVLSDDELERNSKMADEFVDEPTDEDSTDSEDREIISMAYVDETNIQDYSYYDDPSDFAIYSFDGYSFGYTKDFYNEAEKTKYGYKLHADDGSSFYLVVAPRDTGIDMNEELEEYYNHWKSIIYDPDVLVYNDDENSDYRRFIISGLVNSNKNFEIYCLCNIYEDRTELYQLINYIGDCSSEQYDHENYILDTVYRMCSFSGTSYNPRNYQQFINDDMGSKK